MLLGRLHWTLAATHMGRKHFIIRVQPRFIIIDLVSQDRYPYTMLRTMLQSLCVRQILQTEPCRSPLQLIGHGFS
jgi:hypothetical protein